jgi:hypothetical protein
MKIQLSFVLAVLLLSYPAQSEIKSSLATQSMSAPKISDPKKSPSKGHKIESQKTHIPMTVHSPSPKVTPKPQEICPGPNMVSSSDPHSTSYKTPSVGCGYCLGNTRAENSACIECPKGTFIGTGAKANTCITCDWSKEYMKREVYPNGTEGNFCVVCPPGQLASADRRSCITPVLNPDNNGGSNPLGK